MNISKATQLHSGRLQVNDSFDKQAHHSKGATTRETRNGNGNGFQLSVPERGESMRFASPPHNVSLLQPCFPGCLCICHQRERRLGINNRIAGRLRFTYTGLRRAIWNCSLPSCKTRAASCDLLVEYYFPHWMLRRAVSLNILFGHLHQPSVSLTTRNVLPSGHEWFRAAEHGDIVRLRALIKECPSRINDVNPDGCTAVYVSYRSQPFFHVIFPSVSSGSREYLGV